MPLWPGIPISNQAKQQHGYGANDKTAAQARRFHATGLYSYRRLALSRGVARCQFQLRRIKQLIQKLEAGTFDAFFMADHLAVLKMPVIALEAQPHCVTSFGAVYAVGRRWRALSPIPRISASIATGSTTFDRLSLPRRPPLRLAFTTTISGGRAGWNIVTLPQLRTRR